MSNPQASNSKSLPWIGQTIGDRHRYRITSRLGGGGMGDVFLATDTLLGQPVALKMLKDKLVEEVEVRQRFEREALLCAAIRGDHVVQVNDYGLTDEGYPFFVMEYLQGQTLGNLLQKEQRLSIERTIKIISQVCDGLFKAHSGVVMSYEGATSGERISVVHRDLKPDNIFLVNTSLGELAKILDFGIAKVSGKDMQSTNTGLFMGTFQYASPEQIEARKDLDLRADIYSLGMIIYEMLCGTDPFGCIAEGRGGANWLRSHIADSPRSLRSQPDCQHIPEALEAVVLKCLSKSPSDRFDSVASLHQSLQIATGIKTDVMMTRIVSASAETKISTTPNLLISSPIPNPSPDSSTQSTQSNNVSYELKEKLEDMLVSYVGPIAKILVKQNSTSGVDSADLIERLSQHIPPAQQNEFKAKAQTVFREVDRKSTGSSIEVKNMISTLIANPSSSQISKTFLEQCQQELSEVIGPMAKLVIKKALAKNPSQSQLIEAISNLIPDAKQAEKFRKKFN